MSDPPDVVAVLDLGGGSFELAVGTPVLGPAWVRSVDAGALRITRSYLGGDPPPAERVAAARRAIDDLLEDFDPPLPDAALVVGGTARAVGRIVGKPLGVERLEELAELLGSAPAETVTKRHGITTERAQTLLGGTLVLAEIARRLGTDLEVARGGLREGAALALARHVAAVGLGPRTRLRPRSARGRPLDAGGRYSSGTTRPVAHLDRPHAALLAPDLAVEEPLEDLAMRADERRVRQLLEQVRRSPRDPSGASASRHSISRPRCRAIGSTVSRQRA